MFIVITRAYKVPFSIHKYTNKRRVYCCCEWNRIIPCSRKFLRQKIFKVIIVSRVNNIRRVFLISSPTLDCIIYHKNLQGYNKISKFIVLKKIPALSIDIAVNLCVLWNLILYCVWYLVVHGVPAESIVLIRDSKGLVCCLWCVYCVDVLVVCLPVGRVCSSGGV